MAVKINIRKVISVTLWGVVGAGVLVLLVAAIGYRNNKTCKGYKIDIATNANTIGKKEVMDLLVSAGMGKWQGRATASFDLRKMEAMLEKNVWIRNAQLFFDNNGILRINVSEREPIARIFTREGKTCYIDSTGIQLPLSDKQPAKLPVFTGYPAGGRFHGVDSLLVGQVRQLATFIRSDSFWTAQVAQVDIKPDRTFELAPTVGSHVVLFGDGSDYVEKFHRLFLFYKEVLSQTGFDKYSRIDIAYAGQVIGTRKGSEGTKTDSIQGMKNIQAMIRAAQQLQPDTLRQSNVKPLERPVMNEESLTNHDLIPDAHESAAETPANAVKPAAAGKPRAIMPTKPNNRHN